MRKTLQLLLLLGLFVWAGQVSAQVFTANYMLTHQPIKPCAGSPVQFRATDLTGAMSGAVYFWDFGDGTPPWNGTLATVSHIYSGAGTYTVHFNATTSSGADRGTFTIDILPPCGNNDLIVGRVYQDGNSNGNFDPMETARPGEILQDNMGNVVSTDAAGEYSFYFPAGSGYFADLMPIPNHTFVNPASGRRFFGSSGMGNVQPNHNFGVRANANVQDLKVSIAAALPVPGMIRTYHLSYSNMGSMPMNGNVDFTIDPNIIFMAANMGGGLIAPNVVRWNFVGLAPGQTRHVFAQVQVPASLPIGTPVFHKAQIDPIPGDINPGDNVFNLHEVVVAGYDPNDKTVSPAGDGPDGNVPPGTELSYLIRFQNTGTYYAQDITVKDMLDSDLDQTTLEVIGSSHPMSWTLSQSELVFSFPGIMLPDSNMNEPLSHGWIRYSISPKANTPIGARIENSAAIYFDFNPAVITNTTVNTISLSVATEPSQAGQALSIVPHPVGQMATVRFDNPNGLSHSFSLLDLSGKEVSRIEGIGGESFVLDRKGLPAGIYLYRLSDAQGQQVSVGRLVIQ